MHTMFAQGYYTIECKDMRRKWTQAVGPKTNLIEKEMNPGCRAQDQLNTNEPTMPYVKAQEINI